jgi:hypothetical protein
MEAAASSAKSSARNGETSSSLETFPKVAQKTEDVSSASLIQDLQAQVRELQGRISLDAARIRTLEAQLNGLTSSESTEKRRDIMTSREVDFPALLTEDVISSLPMSLPAFEFEDQSVAAAYSDLNRKFSYTAVKAKDAMLALRKAWDISQNTRTVAGTGASAHAASRPSGVSDALASIKIPIQFSKDLSAQVDNPLHTADDLKRAIEHINQCVMFGTSSAADDCDECLKAVACGLLRRDESYVKGVFEKHCTSPLGAEAGLLKQNMRAALIDAHFPMAHGPLATSDDELMQQVDLDSNGRVSFDEFHQFVRQRSSVENWMKTEQLLQIVSDSFVPLLGADAGPDDRMRRLANMSPDQVRRALDAAVIGLGVQFESSLANLNKTLKAVTAQADRLSQSKFELSKLACGTIDDFHKGLESRIGVSPNHAVDFRFLLISGQAHQVLISKTKCTPSTAPSSASTWSLPPATTTSPRMPARSGCT